MEFSWNYEDMMSRLSTNCFYISYRSEEDFKDSCAYCVILTCDIVGNTFEVFAPLSTEDIIDVYKKSNGAEATIAMPLFYCSCREISGADSILKHFLRSGNGAYMAKVRTPKGEVYYGCYGMVFDCDFTPLLFVTKEVSVSPNHSLTVNKYIVHIHPKVFTDDTKVLNKALARKAVAYYLSRSPNGWGVTRAPYEVVIDDCSKFVFKPNKPNLRTFSTEVTTDLLKDNIDEVLAQFADAAM